jgi:hypothetical protein
VDEHSGGKTSQALKMLCPPKKKATRHPIKFFSNTLNSPPTKPTESAQPVFVGSVASVFTSS